MNEFPTGVTDAPERPRPTWRRFLAPMLAAALAGAVVALVPRFIDAFAPVDPYEQALRDMGTEVVELPGFDERFGRVDPDEAFRIGQQLGATSIFRLPDAELSEWLGITRELLDRLDPGRCADVVRGTIDADESVAALKSLDVKTFQRYLEIVMMAMHLELTDAPRPPPVGSPEAADAALATLAQRVGPGRMEEIATTFSNLVQATDDEVCAAARDLYAGLAQIGEAERGAIFRLLNGPLEAARAPR